MATIAPDTPAAQALSNAVHAKLVEEGWTQDDDTSLAEYIVLMLANGKTQDQIASELAGELLQDATGTTEFAQWLFQQVDRMQEASQQPEKPVTQDQSSSDQVQAENPIPAAYEMDMTESAPENAPRGPKGLHGGRPQAGRGRGSMSNKGGDSALHRTRGSDRVNSHGNLRGAPKGPRGSQDRGVRPGMQKVLNNMALANVPGMQNSMMMNGGQSPQTPMQMSPQQQMEFMAMMEQQTRMMAQLTGMMPGGNGVFPPGGAPQNGHGRSLFDRVEPSRGRGGRGRGRGGASANGHIKSPTKTGDQDTAMEGDEQSTASTMDVDQATGQPKQAAGNTMCHFNLRCTNKDCPYAHQSPSAPPGTTVDMSDTCTFGAACKNPKCAGKHPSPAQIKAIQAQEICKFFPNCSRPNCAFKHPNTPLCRFGSNCKTPNCQFTHLEIACHFNPCTNMRCPYKHNPGQQKATTLADYTWTPDKQNLSEQDTSAVSGDHLSDRRFVDENAGEEELVKPEAAGGNGEGVVT